MNRSDAMLALSDAVNRRAAEIFAGDGDDLSRDLAMVAGHALHVAFGSPGDWGYGTDIGRALAAVYASPTAVKGAE